MRKLVFLATAVAASLCLASCEPEVFSMYVEMRNPSASGLDLAGKALSVVYLDDQSGKDTVFNARLAEGFAKALEKDYFNGKESVALYKMTKDKAGDYASRDTMVNSLIETGDDVLFLFDSPEFEDITISGKTPISNGKYNASLSVPFKLNLYAYDSMGLDSVRVFKGSSVLKQTMECEGNATDDEIKQAFIGSLGEAGEKTGEKSSAKFVSTWTPESYSFYYFDGTEWLQAAEYAYEYEWHKAIDKWMSLLNTNSMIKRSAAEINIATAFYLLGDYSLAEQWLAQSDKDEKMQTSPAMWRKILNKKVK